MYLSTPEEGGETIFPLAGEPGEQAECGGNVRTSALLHYGMCVLGWVTAHSLHVTKARLCG